MKESNLLDFIRVCNIWETIAFEDIPYERYKWARNELYDNIIRDISWYDVVQYACKDQKYILKTWCPSIRYDKGRLFLLGFYNYLARVMWYIEEDITMSDLGDANIVCIYRGLLLVA